ncbi:MAG: tRNA dihydrouridine(20/20a) synthase DusA [Candidatus Symbiodolus clandestinus]
MNTFLGRFSVAPMLAYTDRHCRYFHRLLSQQALLYTEMVTTEALLHSRQDLLAYSLEEQPLALQLAGSDPVSLAICAQRAEQRGYAEVNLNVGCPSNRVQQGRFGACLMADARQVADCIQAMREQVSIPVTVKTRLGIDQQDSYAFLADFIDTVASVGGCQAFIIHARKAWLSGLSPKENREIPPLDYSRVYRLKRDFPQLTIILNGGVQSIDEAKQHLTKVDGIMMGRAAYHYPQWLAQVDRALFDRQAIEREPITVVQAFYPYIQQQLRQGTPLHSMTRHLLGLFHQWPGARRWRRYLSEHSFQPLADLSVVQRALEFVVSC